MKHKKIFTIGMVLGMALIIVIGAKITTNILKVGNKTGEDVSVMFDVGQANNPVIKWDNAAAKLKFTNDGTNFFDIGSGSGNGSGGVNLLADSNPGFENGTSNWTETGASTFSVTTAAGEVGYDGKSGKWDPSASGEYLNSDLVAITNGLKGNNCLVEANYIWASGTSGDIKLEATDGSNVLVAVDLVKSSQWTRAFAAFTCPTTGSLRLRLTSTANAAEVTVDNLFLGENHNLIDISQAEEVGHIEWYATNCDWFRNSVGSGILQDFGVDSDCTSSGIRGKASEPSTKLPGIKISDVQPGIYYVVAEGVFGSVSSTTGVENFIGLTDGTTNGTKVHIEQTNSGSYGYANLISTTFKYDTAQGDKTFKLMGQIANASGAQIHVIANNAEKPLKISVFRYPLASQKAVSLDTQSRDAGILIDGPGVSYNATSSWTTATNAAFATKTFFGNAKEETTNNIQLSMDGVPAGRYMVIWSGAILAYNGPNRCVMAIYDGTNRRGIVGARTEASNSMDKITTTHAIFDYASVGNRTWQFQIRHQDGTGSCLTDANSEAQFSMSVIPLTQNFPQAVAITDINPIYMTDSAATKAGYKTYLADISGGSNDIAYKDGNKATITSNTGTWTSCQYAELTPYQMQDGSWRLKGNVSCLHGSLTTGVKSIIINGIASKNITNYIQTFAAYTSNTSSCGYQCTTQYAVGNSIGPNTNVFQLNSNTTWNVGVINFDILLNSKPTWAY